MSKLEQNSQTSVRGAQIKKESDEERGKRERKTGGRKRGERKKGEGPFLITGEARTQAREEQRKKRKKRGNARSDPAGVTNPAIFMFSDYL